MIIIIMNYANTRDITNIVGTSKIVCVFVFWNNFYSEIVPNKHNIKRIEVFE